MALKRTIRNIPQKKQNFYYIFNVVTKKQEKKKKSLGIYRKKKKKRRSIIIKLDTEKEKTSRPHDWNVTSLFWSHYNGNLLCLSTRESWSLKMFMFNQILLGYLLPLHFCSLARSLSCLLESMHRLTYAPHGISMAQNHTIILCLCVVYFFILWLKWMNQRNREKKLLRRRKIFSFRSQHIAHISHIILCVCKRVTCPHCILLCPLLFIYYIHIVEPYLICIL